MPCRQNFRTTHQHGNRHRPGEQHGDGLRCEAECGTYTVARIEQAKSGTDDQGQDGKNELIHDLRSFGWRKDSWADTWDVWRITSGLLSMRLHHAIQIAELPAALEHLGETRKIDRVAVTERPRLLRDPVPVRFEGRITESKRDMKFAIVADLHDQHVVGKNLAHGGEMLDALGARAGEVGNQHALRRQRRPRLAVELMVIDRRRNRPGRKRRA